MRRIQRAIYILMLSTLFAGALGGAVSCSKVQSDTTSDTFRPNFRLTFSVPVDTKSTTAAGYGDPDNNEGTDNSLSVRDLEVYFFDTEGRLVSSVTDFSDIRLTPVSSDGYDPHSHLYDVQMRVSGIMKGLQYRVVILANKRSTLGSSLPFSVPAFDDWMNTGVGNTDEERLYNSLEFNYSSTGIKGIRDYLSLNFGMNENAYVPMWGFAKLTADAELGENGRAPEFLPSSGIVELLRALAKVRIDFAPELLETVEPTAFNEETLLGGIKLCNPVNTGFMTPAYSKVSSLQATPNIINRDRQGGSPTGLYTNEWINRGQSSDESSVGVYPMYRKGNSFYTYMPEAYMGQAWMELEFAWKQNGVPTSITHNYKLHFSDYDDARDYYGVEPGVALTEEQLEKFEFPVMRNHYYIYTITGLNPLKLKFEVCEWQYRSTDIYFN